MNLSLTIGSLIAIAILAWLAGRLFPASKPLDKGRVERNLLRYEPDARISDILISEDGLAALVVLSAPEGHFGLLRQLGDRVVCRVMAKTDVLKVYWSHAGVTIASTDFTQPEVTLVLNDKGRQQAATLLNSITKVAETAHAA